MWWQDVAIQPLVFAMEISKPHTFPHTLVCTRWFRWMWALVCCNVSVANELKTNEYDVVTEHRTLTHSSAANEEKSKSLVDRTGYELLILNSCLGASDITIYNTVEWNKYGCSVCVCVCEERAKSYINRAEWMTLSAATIQSIKCVHSRDNILYRIRNGPKSL